MATRKNGNNDGKVTLDVKIITGNYNKIDMYLMKKLNVIGKNDKDDLSISSIKILKQKRLENDRVNVTRIEVTFSDKSIENVDIDLTTSKASINNDGEFKYLDGHAIKLRRRNFAINNIPHTACVLSNNAKVMGCSGNISSDVDQLLFMEDEVAFPVEIFVNGIMYEVTADEKIKEVKAPVEYRKDLFEKCIIEGIDPMEFVYNAGKNIVAKYKEHGFTKDAFEYFAKLDACGLHYKVLYV